MYPDLDIRLSNEEARYPLPMFIKRSGTDVATHVTETARDGFSYPRESDRFQPRKDPASDIENWENEGGALSEQRSHRLLSRIRDGRRHLEWANEVGNPQESHS